MRMELKNVSFAYKSSQTPVLHDINLVLEEPGLYCIVGPNGVGKSTMVKCMNRILKPTSGQVLLNDVDIQDMKLKEIAEHIGYVPVQTQDVFSMPVIDAILLGRQKANKWKTTDEDLEIAARVMKMMGIQDLAMRGFNHLSAGQHQKVAIARGLVQQPEMLILDEPTANLDVKHQVYVSELLRAMAIEENMIVLMISHDLNIAAKYAHKIIVMEHGTVVDVGTSKDIITEDLVARVYEVECKIEDDEDRPHVVLGSVLSI
ncbi:MAG: ABC transporter ATP-binding protein [Thermoplasmatales archaeon]|jgi:iron complex transport system ATP-binding protein|nr:ABC transporter ATP-binding protein [Thermoplasmatales archaeon]